jgi:hypothetical protein
MMSLVHFQATEYEMLLSYVILVLPPTPGQPLYLPERQRQSAKELKKEIKKERDKTEERYQERARQDRQTDVTWLL